MVLLSKTKNSKLREFTTITGKDSTFSRELSGNPTFRKIKVVAEANGYTVDSAYWRVGSSGNRVFLNFSVRPSNKGMNDFHPSIYVKAREDRGMKVDIELNQSAYGSVSGRDMELLIKHNQEAINFIKFLQNVNFDTLPEFYFSN